MGGVILTAFQTVLIILCAILLTVCTISLVFQKRQNKRINDLVYGIDNFIENGTLTSFSVSDDNFAKLQNAVLDLETIIQIEKNNTLSETRKNTEFISDVSHQLKTPLAGMRLYCEMQNADSPTKYTEKELQLIEKMESLIQNLLRLEKIKSDAYIMNFKMHDVKSIVLESVDEFSNLFPQKAYTVTGNSNMRCDKTWLSEAIGNVIKNASEHTKPNGIITINIDDSKQATTIDICDNGGGMNDEDLPNLFTRFYSTENALPSSAGIGLAITKAIVEKHHGIISAENSKEGLRIIMCFGHLDGYIAI